MIRILESEPLPEITKVFDGLKVFVVGGFVRDALLQRRTRDIDLVVLGKEEDFFSAVGLLSRLTGSEPVISRFYTAKADFQGYRIDLTLARIERYAHPGALPSVEPAQSIQDDLARRDFAANAVAMGLDGQLVDPFNGLSDIKAKTLRVLHPNSFKDDPTRAFRCVRYEHQLGFSVHPDTEKVFPDAIQHMKSVSFERIRAELIRISNLSSEARAMAWVELCQRGLLPGLSLDPRVARELASITENWVCFYGLAGGKPESGMTKQEIRVLRAITENAGRRFRDLAHVHEILKNAPELSLVALSVLDPLIREYARKKHSIKPLVRPEELLDMGFEPRDIGKALLEIEKARLTGLVKDIQDEKALLSKIKREN